MKDREAQFGGKYGKKIGKLAVVAWMATAGLDRWQRLRIP